MLSPNISIQPLAAMLTFNTVEAEYNQYVPINTAQVIAARFYSFISFGEVAFEEQPILGRAGPRGNDVRGYSTGRYRGDQLYDLQAEWRWRFLQTLWNGCLWQHVICWK